MLSDVREQMARAFEYATLRRCSRWAEKVRIMPPPYPGPWSFTHHPWLRTPHDDDTQEVYIKKAAQMGFTELALNKSLFVIDQHRRNVLYIFPSLRPDAADFSKGRLNSAMEHSEYINNLFSESKSETQKISNNRCSLYLRGAKSPIKSMDCALVVLDEAAEISMSAIALARHRMSGQPDTEYKQLIALSTPTADGIGIDALFADTDQSHFMFRCPHCSRMTELTYPECLVVTAERHSDPKVANSHLVCKECNAILDHRSKTEWLSTAEWVPTQQNMNARGYYINQLYSTARSPASIAKEALRAENSPIDQAEFYNSCLGLCYTPENSRLSDADLNEATGDHTNNDKRPSGNYLVTMGMDIGQRRHHVSIVGWRLSPHSNDILEASAGQLLYYGTVNDYEEADHLMQQWKPRMTVVDAQPDLKSSIALATKYKKVCYACYYSIAKNSRKINVNDNDGTISVNRTFWMSQVLAKIQTRTLSLPRDMDMDFRQQLMSPIRVYKTDNNGMQYALFTKREQAEDHYYHSLTYAIIALGMSAGHGSVEYY